MPLRTLITILAVVITAAGLTVATIFWATGGTVPAWALPIPVALAMGLRVYLKRST